MKKILIIGTGGQVASNLAEVFFNAPYIEYKTMGRSVLDLAKPSHVRDRLSELPFLPDVVINAAAYTAVDNAEDEKELCNNVNHISASEIAKFCLERKIPLIHYSTDYVFDGSGKEPFREDDQMHLNPVNYYGRTKLYGEHAIINSGCEYIILRTSWVYNHKGRNFVNTILRLAAERDELNIVDDQIGSPTYALDIARATLKILNSGRFTSGIYHLVPEESMSWFEFTNFIVSIAKGKGVALKVRKILPILTTEFPTKAKRPLNSRLSVEKIENIYNIKLPGVENSLTECLNKIDFSKIS